MPFTGARRGASAAVKHKADGAVMMLSKGVGIRASRKPIAEYARKPGETIGHYWYIPNVRKTGQFAHVLVDVNYWRRFVHEGPATAAGPSCWRRLLTCCCQISAK